jgi:hypothetical protein
VRHRESHRRKAPLMRLLAIVAGSVLLGLVTVTVAGHALMEGGSSKVLRLTKVGPGVYRTSDTPTFYYYTRNGTAPADRTRVRLSLGDTLQFPTGESCYCSVILPWTRQEDWGVIRTAAHPVDLGPRNGARGAWGSLSERSVRAFG